MDTICKEAFKLRVAEKYQARWLTALVIRGTYTKRMRTYLKAILLAKTRHRLILGEEEYKDPWNVSWVAGENIHWCSHLWLIVWHHVLKWNIQIPEDQESFQVAITSKEILQDLEDSWVRRPTPEKLTRENLTTYVESPMLKMDAGVNKLVSSHNDSSQSSKQWTSAAYEMDGS